MSTNFIKEAPLPSYEQLVNCMHCGMCLPTCPTYQLTGLEINSPRGRIHMIRGVADGHLEITDKFKESIEFCLNCQACVTACPAGVQYGHLVESAQLQIAAVEQKKRGRPSWREIILNWLFLDLKRLHHLARLIRIYQISRVEKLVQVSGFLNLLSKKIHEMSFMPPIVPRKKSYIVDKVIKEGEEKRIKVGMLKGCVQDIFFRDVNQDTIDVLEKNGYQVYLPEEDICCGSVHGHNGDMKTAKILARKIIEIFDRTDVDYIILNSAGCGAYMKEYEALFADEPKYYAKARTFSLKVRD
ncbi:MAG: 4Fe-4S dicluster domain-containing protein, partial [Deltaproteobacteria bacterium]|nr:4Fe-4S dicluster domain-containing protein [Deltaproteobacteria bacterium]